MFRTSIEHIQHESLIDDSISLIHAVGNFYVLGWLPVTNLREICRTIPRLHAATETSQSETAWQIDEQGEWNTQSLGHKLNHQQKYTISLQH